MYTDCVARVLLSADTVTLRSDLNVSVATPAPASGPGVADDPS